MSWKRSLWVMLFFFLAGLAAAGVVMSRMKIDGSPRVVMGVRSIFPDSEPAPVTDAKNGWQGFAFKGRFRFFRRPSAHAVEDLRKLKQQNFRTARRQVDLDLFDGGFYVIQRAGKGYSLFCLFCREGMTYWADMFAASSLDFSLRAFERFILNLEIGGQGIAPAVFGQVAALRRQVSPLMIQTVAQFLGLMGVIFALTLLIVFMVFRFSGAPPRRADPASGECTPYATLRIGGFGRRKITACCLCREGEFLVIYRFRRPYMKVDIRRERDEIVWERTSFRYRNIRVTLGYDEFEKWRLRLMA